MQSFRSKKQLILYFLRGSLRYFAAAACFAALVSLFDMVSPKIISFAVDCVIGSKEPELPGAFAGLLARAGGIEGVRAHLLRIAALVAATGALAALMRFLFRKCNAAGAERFVERMRGELFSHILKLPFTWLGENSTGDIIQRCTSDVQTIKKFVSEQLTALVRTVILIVMALYFMSTISVRIMLAGAAFIPVIIGYSVFFHSRIGSAFEKADEEEGRLSTIAQENLTGVRVVRAFGRELYERDRFEKQNAYYTDFWIRLIRLLSIFWCVGDVMEGLQILTVTVLGASACVAGTLTAGNFIALISYILMLAWPERSIGRVISEMSKAGISVERLRYIMNAKPERDRENAVTPPLDQDIVFDRVSFAYENGTGEVLQDISFSVPAGSTVGILGATGSGKSTLMYLLTRLYELAPGNGEIRIGGIPVSDIKAGYLRENIGMVLQEPYLFSRTLSENIGIAVESPDMEMIRSAASVACIDDAIVKFRKGYDTFVGERGVTLSGGQKQRTAIAQMLIRRPPVMVFDDSLSSVDAETDRKIREALRENTAGSTVFLIAHRVATLMHADQIIVLDKGKIKEQGTHASLLAANGLYRKVFELQSAGDGSEFT